LRTARASSVLVRTVMVARPSARPVTTPLLSTAATVVSPESQCRTSAEKVPSPFLAVAVKRV